MAETMSLLSYLINPYLMYSASAFAANTFIRSAVATGFPLFTVQLFNTYFDRLHRAPALAATFLFYKYGARIRAHSKFAPFIVLQIAADLEKEEYATP